MSEQPGQGRARGRGGRGRGVRQEQATQPGGQPPRQQAPPRQAQGDAVQAPAPPKGRARGRGQQQQTQPKPQPPVGGNGNGGNGGNGEGYIGGRGVHRGGGRERPAPPTEAMAAMDISAKGDYKRRNPYDRYVETTWRPRDKPVVGGQGKQTTLLSNYFKVSLPSEKRMFQYHVSFKPPIENMKVKFALMSSISDVLGEAKIFDGGVLYLTRLLPKDPQVCMTKRHYDNLPVEITFKFTNEVQATSPQFLHIANLIFRKIQIALDMKQIRDHFFNLNLSVQVPRHKLEVMPGFTTAIAKHNAGNLLCVDIVHKILRIDTYLDNMYTLYDECRGDQARFQDECCKQLVGVIVMTKYNNRTYKVDDIAWNKNPLDTFEKGGEKMSFVDYYQKSWNITIMDHQQPLLVTRPTERDKRRGQTENLYLLPEVCTVTGLTDKARADYNVMKDLGVHTRIEPTARVKTLEGLMSQVAQSQKCQELLTKWSVTMDKKVLQIPAREMLAEELLMGRNQKISYDIKKADWSRQMRSQQLLNPVHMDHWLIVYTNRASQQAMELSECLNRVGKGMGMRISQPTTTELSNDKNDTYLQGIKSNMSQQTQMVVCILPQNRKDRYDAIKKCCCIENPVPSQVVVQRTLMKKGGLMSVATKIAIQMACKMGGEVWGAVIPMRDVMVVGLDTYHDSLHKGQSVGAMVASLNRECTRYFSKTEMHPSKDELMRNFTVLFAAALRKFHEVNKCNPRKIIVYRDGVGDGQLKYVYESEKAQMDLAIKEAGGPDFKPEVAFIVVKKRINTRVFGREGPNLINPQPGTVVDQGVTKDEWYDFFLVSQSVNQGTVSPTSYNVIFDESGLRPEHLQQLSYKLTHLYFNWQGTIRVPAPCQYAHKLAFLQGQSLHREPSAYLADKLFYL